MTRGTEQRQRKRSVTVRLTEPEYNAAKAKADASGYAIGAFTRATLLGSAEPRARHRVPADRRELARLLGEVNRVGNNINQIARALNAGQPYNHPDLEQALKEVNDIRHAIRDALGHKTSAP